MSQFPNVNDPRRPAPPPTRRVISSLVVLAARRYHLIRWAVAGSAVLVLTLSVTNARARATAAESRWADLRTVWVATSDLGAGGLLTDSDTHRVELPMAAIPRDASTTSPIGRRLHDDLAEGEILRDGRLADTSASEAAALLGPRSRGVTLRIDDGGGLVVGDRVDLLALVDGRPLAANAVVVATDDRGWATFSVPEGRVSAVVREISAGGVIPVLVP